MGGVATGRIRRVAGPLVEVDDLGAVAMYDLVALGSTGIPGEVVRIRDHLVTVQAYEYTGGLAPGDTALPRGRPLSARLGPGLLGGVFDGLLRPLSTADTFLTQARESASGRAWRFQPHVQVGEQVSGGDVIGVISQAGLEYRILAPVDGAIEAVAEGDQREDAVVATVGGTNVGVCTQWPVRQPRPHRGRRDVAEPLHTGQRVLDLLFPIARGGSAAVPGGFGTGKTVLLQQIAKWCDADVIVYVGCGERGNEMAEIVADLFGLIDPRTGGRLADRTVVIANTSDMPMMAREASMYTGVTVAEHFRDMGYDTVVIADSTSRWAEALREFASRTGVLPTEEGYPADLASALAAFYERAGTVTTLSGRTGSVSIIGAVSPPGGDMTEPVTAHTERFVRCRWALDRDLAYARHYPAVSWSESVSRDAEALGRHHVRAGDADWPHRRARIATLLTDAGRLADLAELVGTATLPALERMVLLGGRLVRTAFLQQSALSIVDSFCSGEKTAALAEIAVSVADECGRLVRAGVAAEVVEEFDFSALVQAKDQAGEADEVRRCGDAMLARLRELAP